METQPHRKLTVKAIVLSKDKDRVLLIRYECPGDSVHYSFPGGRILPSEALKAGLARRVQEETSIRPEVGELAFVVDYTPSTQGSAFGSLAKLQLVFWAVAPDSAKAAPPDEPEDGFAGLEWVRLSDLSRFPLRPAVAGLLAGSKEGLPRLVRYDNGLPG